ncbi:MAG: S-layer homology domain-containing protein, partial [Gorillibacterium sp.]|nr:S-layer homology domain-containing protein [Gorillibacterium sp.]
NKYQKITIVRFNTTILNTYEPSQQLTREQLAVLLTAIVKYNKVSVYLNEDAAVSKFSDAAAIKNRGAVAVAVMLGLMQGENGKFNPTQTVSKAQAATVIMKLVELQGKIDQKIGEQ